MREALAAVEAQLKRLDPTSAEAIEKWERALNDENRHAGAEEDRGHLPGRAERPQRRSRSKTLEAAYRKNDLARHVVGGLDQSARRRRSNADVFAARNELAEGPRDAQEAASRRR